ncbi:MAG: asparagine synthase (glutamine-hydrolyzing) [Rhodospirillaceae bacterium]
MCGIYGVLRLDGKPADAGLVQRMGRVVVHRGPDDDGCHLDGPCAIGMRRLSIIDLAGGHQPLSDSSGTLWLVCNGEIYNFRELRAELQARGHVFRTGSDSEVVIHGYAEFGDEVVGKLNGMFAFALWDASRARLLIGRDRLGIKPVYLCQTAQWLAFASEAKALLTLSGMSPGMDMQALSAYLNLGYVPAPLSMFAGITKLPPATLLVAERKHVEQRTYWHLPPDVDRSSSEGEWIERARDGIAQSVRRQTVSDVPVGAFLSGGIDSSAVVGHMAMQSRQRVRTYAIGFGGDAAGEYYNELPYARRVAQLFGTDHHEILVRPDVVALLPRLLWHMDEPVCDSAFVTTYLVSQFARKDVKVILSGVGGDEIFGGYRRYLGNHYHERYARLPAWMRGAARSAGRRLPSDRHAPLLNMARLAKEFLRSAELPFEARYRSYVQVFDQQEMHGLLCYAVKPYDFVAAAFDRCPHHDAMQRMLSVDAQTQLPDDLLLLTDKMSMSVSLECRVPLLDHELVELAARIPGDVKMRGGRLKHVMKAALAPLLPRDILERKKRGFGTPMGAWLKKDIRPVVDHLLSRRAVERRGIFRHAAVQSLVAEHEAARTDATDRLLALLNLEIWARLYLDTRAPQDVQAEMEEALA